MPPEIEWHGDEAREYVRKRALRFVAAACIAIKRRAKELLSVSGTGVRVKDGLSKHGQLQETKRRKRKVAKYANKALKLGKKLGLTKTKTRLRVQKNGKLTTRKARRKKKS